MEGFHGSKDDDIIAVMDWSYVDEEGRESSNPRQAQPRDELMQLDQVGPDQPRTDQEKEQGKEPSGKNADPHPPLTLHINSPPHSPSPQSLEVDEEDILSPLGLLGGPADPLLDNQSTVYPSMSAMAPPPDGTISPAAINPSSSSEDNSSFQLPCLAYLDFPDCRYYVSSKALIIGRNPDQSLALRISPEYGAEDDRVSSSSRKRKREEEAYCSDGDEEYNRESDERFGGGLGGSQEHPNLPAESDTQYIYVIPPSDSSKSQFRFQSISKKHLSISYDETYGWIVEVLGRNGVYVNEDFYQQGQKLYLDDGDRFSVAHLLFTFRCNPPGEGSDDEDEMSDVGSRRHSGISNEGVTEIALNGRHRLATEGGEEDEEEDDEDEDGVDEDGVAEPANAQQRKRGRPSTKTPKKTPTKIKLKTKRRNETESRDDREGQSGDTSVVPTIEDKDGADGEAPKRRGPGRPPADGIMSKRERKAREKAEREGRDYRDATVQVSKNGRSRKDSTANAPEEEVSVVSKKEKKSKRTAENTALKKSPGSAAPASEPPPPPPPKEPSPRREDFTEEQLKPPTESYAVTLHSILADNAAEGRCLSLPEIYQEYKRRFPYYRFCGKGWESSVRHNVKTAGIKKAGRASKGHYWTIDPSVPFESKSMKRESAHHTPSYPSQAPAAPTSYGPSQDLVMRTPSGHPAGNSYTLNQYNQTPTQYNPFQRISDGQPPNNGFQGVQRLNGVSQNAQTQSFPAQNSTIPNNNFGVRNTASVAASPRATSITGVPSSNASNFQFSTQGAPPNPPSSSTSNQNHHPSVHPGASRIIPTPSRPINASTTVAGGQTTPPSQAPPQAQTIPARSVTTSSNQAAQNGPSVKAPTLGDEIAQATKEERDNIDRTLIQFKGSFVGMANGPTQQARYAMMVDQGMEWLKTHPTDATYDGTDKDTAQIVTTLRNMLQQKFWKNRSGQRQAKTPTSGSSPAPPQTTTRVSGQNQSISPLSEPQPPAPQIQKPSVSEPLPVSSQNVSSSASQPSILGAQNPQATTTLLSTSNAASSNDLPDQGAIAQPSVSSKSGNLIANNGNATSPDVLNPDKQENETAHNGQLSNGLSDTNTNPSTVNHQPPEAQLALEGQS